MRVDGLSEEGMRSAVVAACPVREPDHLAFTMAVLRMHRPCGWQGHGTVPWCSCGTPLALCPYRQLALVHLNPA